MISISTDRTTTKKKILAGKTTKKIVKVIVMLQNHIRMIQMKLSKGQYSPRGTCGAGASMTEMLKATVAVAGEEGDWRRKQGWAEMFGGRLASLFSASRRSRKRKARRRKQEARSGSSNSSQ